VRRRLSFLLFVITLLTTMIAGSLTAGADLLGDPFALLEGIPFAASLMGILGVHELGHFIASRRHRVRATLPLFIPGIWPFGTFGALIKIKSLIPDRRVLLDIGVAGPLSGFLAALPIAVIGLVHSRVETGAASPGAAISFGSPLIFVALENLVVGPRPADASLFLHPVAFAAWIGFFVTGLNLLPVGQLDGGHILYALFGRRQVAFARALLLVFIPLGFFWPGWFFWGALMCFIGYRHPPVLREEIPLDGKRKALGFVAAAILVLTFMPVPLAAF
jgi:membrane-associated protease RseP (regulator of RpoE activity)